MLVKPCCRVLRAVIPACLVVMLMTSLAPVAAARVHTAASVAAGPLWTWGHNGLGELGDGSTPNRPSSVATKAVSGGARLYRVTDVAGDAPS